MCECVDIDFEYMRERCELLLANVFLWVCVCVRGIQCKVARYVFLLLRWICGNMDLKKNLPIKRGYRSKVETKNINHTNGCHKIKIPNS